MAKSPSKGKKRPAAKGRPRPRARSNEALEDARRKRARIFHIAQLIAGGEWEPEMAGELATLWELNVNTVRKYSAEASRLVELTTGDRQKLIDLVKVKLRQWVQEGVQDRVPAARTLLEHLGELRQNVSVTTPDQFEGWTEEEVERFIATGERPKKAGGEK